MPYIAQKERGELDWAERGPETPGELNYTLTKAILSYMQGKPKSYTLYNEVVGAPECCKLELYRRPIASYEDDKLRLNGEVYP